MASCRSNKFIDSQYSVIYLFTACEYVCDSWFVCMLSRFCNPLESQADSQQLRDFEFAQQELAAKQNAQYVF